MVVGAQRCFGRDYNDQRSPRFWPPFPFGSRARGRHRRPAAGREPLWLRLWAAGNAGQKVPSPDRRAGQAGERDKPEMVLLETSRAEIPGLRWDEGLREDAAPESGSGFGVRPG